MDFEAIKDLPDEKFRRVTGVKAATFDKAVEILTKADLVKMSKGGRPSKLSIQNKLLMTLEYWREYRTYIKIGASYGVSESNAYKNIKWVEDTLKTSGIFTLPGKKSLADEGDDYEVILIDATETPVERPQKTAKILLWQEKAAYDKDASSCGTVKSKDNLR